MPGHQVLEHIVAGTEESFNSIKSEISNYQGEMIPIPFLAGLIKVDQGTINARLRRESAKKTTIGRTNYIAKILAMKYAEMNASAINNWPTTSEFSAHCSPDNLEAEKIAKTLVYLCRNGNLRGKIDLTKKWRINPIDENKAKEMIKAIYVPEIFEIKGEKHYSLAIASKDAASTLTSPGTPEFEKEYERLHKRFLSRVENQRVPFIKIGKCYYVPEHVYKKMVDPSLVKYRKRTNPDAPDNKIKNIEESYKLYRASLEVKSHTDVQPQIQSQAGPINLAEDTHKVILLSSPQKELEKSPVSPEAPYSPKPPECSKSSINNETKTGRLIYNPDNPPSIKECIIGRTLKYGQMIGTIAKVIEGDGYQPQIELALPERFGKSDKINLVIKGKFAR